MITEQQGVTDRLLAEDPDPELEEALEHLRLHYWHLHKVVREYRENPERLEDWAQAPLHSQAWRKSLQLSQALRVLQLGLSD